MRYSVLALIVITNVSVLIPIGCKQTTIGQPCQFSYLENTGSTNPAPCTSLPQCHPLLADPSGGVPGPACPLDCIQTSPIQCEDLFCVTTQVPNDFQDMNGQCTLVDNPSDTQCPKTLSSCMGYCTKECNTDKDCPKDYTCNTVAPYSLPCSTADQSNWGETCTGDCVTQGLQVDSPSTTCDVTADNCCPAAPTPASTPPTETSTPEYLALVKSRCNQDNGQYDNCCYCICSTICPWQNLKVCRKSTYDAKMFPNGSLSDADFNTLNGCNPQPSQ
jgi:hypothetical protein